MKKIFIAAIVGLVFCLTPAANAEVVTVTDGKHFANCNTIEDEVKRLDKKKTKYQKERERVEKEDKERGEDPKPKFSGLG